LQETSARHHSAQSAEQQRSPALLVPPIAARYLTQQGFTAEEQVKLMQLGLEFVTQAEAERRCGKRSGAFAEWREFIWLPRRDPNGRVVRDHGHAVMLRSEPSFHGERIERERTNPDGSTAPNHVSFFGPGWFGYGGEIVLHESWIKAALEHLRTGARTIGLNGINGLKYTDVAGNKRVVDEFANPPWSLAATLRIVFDSPDKTSPESAANLKAAKDKIALTLGNSVAAVYDSSVPMPTDSRASQDINDFYRDAGDEAFAYLARNRRLIRRRLGEGALLVPAGEVVKRDPPRWIVHNLIAADELTLIVGATSCGSFLTMDLLLAIATGRPHWFGKAVRGKGFTVHITLEGAGMASRLRAYQKHHKVTDLSNHLLIEVPLNMRDADVVDRVIAAIHEHITRSDVPLAAIAIDTVNRAITGGDENSSRDMGEFIAQVERLRMEFAGSAVILVHHSGKDESKGARGHSSLSAAVGGQLDVQTGNDGVRSINVAKQREGQAGYVLSGFGLDSVELELDRYGDPQSSCVVVQCATATSPADDPLALYEVMRAYWLIHHNEPVAQSFIRDRGLLDFCTQELGTRISRDRASKAWTAAEAAGLLKEAGERNGGITYELGARKATKY
jgi:hypothetical protein